MDDSAQAFADFISDAEEKAQGIRDKHGLDAVIVVGIEFDDERLHVVCAGDAHGLGDSIRRTALAELIGAERVEGKTERDNGAARVRHPFDIAMDERTQE